MVLPSPVTGHGEATPLPLPPPKKRFYLQSITDLWDLNSGHFMELSTPILVMDAV